AVLQSIFSRARPPPLQGRCGLAKTGGVRPRPVPSRVQDRDRGSGDSCRFRFLVPFSSRCFFSGRNALQLPCSRRRGAQDAASGRRGPGGTVMSLELTSPAFRDGQAIPAQFTADGRDVSPPLRWGEPPAGTHGFALVCEDPDAPRGTWAHWVLFNL